MVTLAPPLPSTPDVLPAGGPLPAAGHSPDSPRTGELRPRTEVVVSYQPRGAARALFACRAPEVLMAGPAGTGKSRACLEKLHLAAGKYPGMRGLILRQTLSSLTSTGLVTYREKVLHPLDHVVFFGGNKEEPAQYRYPNGSQLVVGGLDKPTKIMSAEYDMIYVQEATEVSQDAWELLTTRLRNGVLPYQQLSADCNPGPPSHWLKARADAGLLTLLHSRHEDNPAVTAAYLATLDRLTGVRYLRLRRGVWAAAEGLVYEGWDPRLHLCDPFPVPASWPRYWAVDFGYTHPFVWQAWAEDPDGRLYRYREIYRTGRLVEEHAADIRRLTADEPRPRAVWCDHDAEDRATLERHLGLPTQAAVKNVSAGIQGVASRLQVAGDGKPRLFLLRDALVEPDPALVDAHKPLCTEQEIEGYVWDTRAGRRKGEEPVKEADHGVDTTRYLVASRDRVDLAATRSTRPAVGLPRSEWAARPAHSAGTAVARRSPLSLARGGR